jgi:hypothetical protein
MARWAGIVAGVKLRAFLAEYYVFILPAVLVLACLIYDARGHTIPAFVTTRP